MNFYEVKAKCGHVGKKYYYEGTFYEVAEDGKQAASNARIRPRVKHNHPDAILSVKKITLEEYLYGKQQKNEEIYFKCENVQDQNIFWKEIENKVFPEERYLVEEEYCELKWKNPYKRKRFNWKKLFLEVA